MPAWLPSGTYRMAMSRLRKRLWRFYASTRPGTSNFWYLTCSGQNLGNILWKCVRTDRVSVKSASEALAGILEYGFLTVGAAELVEDALAIALSTGRTVYDAMYVALAVQRNAAFVTADERLVNSLATHWPVKWLGVL